MQVILSEVKPSIIMEVGDLPNNLVDSVDLVGLLIEKQYQVFRYSDGTLEQVEGPAESEYKPGNRLFVPKSREWNNNLVESKSSHGVMKT